MKRRLADNSVNFHAKCLPEGKTWKSDRSQCIVNLKEYELTLECHTSEIGVCFGVYTRGPTGLTPDQAVTDS